MKVWVFQKDLVFIQWVKISHDSNNFHSHSNNNSLNKVTISLTKIKEDNSNRTNKTNKTNKINFNNLDSLTPIHNSFNKIRFKIKIKCKIKTNFLIKVKTHMVIKIKIIKEDFEEF